MAKFTLPRDLYHGKGTLETLKTLKGKRAVLCVGGGSMTVSYTHLNRARGGWIKFCPARISFSALRWPIWTK